MNQLTGSFLVGNGTYLRSFLLTIFHSIAAELYYRFVLQNDVRLLNQVKAPRQSNLQ